MAESADNTAQESALDVNAEQIARTYAQGFLGASGGDNAALEDLEAVDAEVFQSHPRFREAFGSAFLDHDARVAMLDRVLGGRVTPAVLNLLKVLSAHGRTELVSEVTRQARLLLDEQQGRAPVLVRLAHSVPQSLIDEIAQTIRSKAGFEPIVSVEVDPDLVGGLEVRMGDTVFDGTVRTAFKIAHRAIVDQTVEAIESQPERFTLAE